MLVKDEKLKLKELFEAGEPVSRIAAELSKMKNVVGHKLWCLGLKEGTRQKSFVPSSSTEVELSAGAIIRCCTSIKCILLG
jgi:hypothetical protein